MIWVALLLLETLLVCLGVLAYFLGSRVGFLIAWSGAGILGGCLLLAGLWKAIAS